jgi:hypothetical protein
VEKNEKKESKTGFLARIGPHTSFTLSFRFASKVRMKIAHRVGEKKRAKQVFLHEYWSSHKFHPQFWSCLLHSFTHTHNLHLNQRLVSTKNSCKCCELLLITSFIKQYSISLTFPTIHSNWGWNRDLKGDQKPGWF